MNLSYMMKKKTMEKIKALLLGMEFIKWRNKNEC